MDWFTSLILGLIQGITEFLPVSSSGHLDIGIAFFGLTDPKSNLSFVVFLHFTCLVAIIVVLFGEIKEIFTRQKINTILWIIIATIPAGVIGIIFNRTIEIFFSRQRLYLVGIALIINGLILMIGEVSGWGERKPAEKAGPVTSFIIGLAQAIAILPGISRSGSTIATGLMSGLDKKAAVTFSFFLAIPVILGAAILELKDFSKFTATFQPIPILCGGVTSLITSIIAIKLLIRLVRNSKLYYFSIYCFLVGMIVLLVELI